MFLIVYVDFASSYVWHSLMHSSKIYPTQSSIVLFIFIYMFFNRIYSFVLIIYDYFYCYYIVDGFYGGNLFFGADSNDSIGDLFFNEWFYVNCCSSIIQ